MRDHHPPTTDSLSTCGVHLPQLDPSTLSFDSSFTMSPPQHSTAPMFYFPNALTAPGTAAALHPHADPSIYRWLPHPGNPLLFVQFDQSPNQLAALGLRGPATLTYPAYGYGYSPTELTFGFPFMPDVPTLKLNIHDNVNVNAANNKLSSANPIDVFGTRSPDSEAILTERILPAPNLAGPFSSVDSLVTLRDQVGGLGDGVGELHTGKVAPSDPSRPGATTSKTAPMELAPSIDDAPIEPAPRIAPRKRSRIAQACERCRIRKAKCFCGKPCNRCEKRKFACEFAPSRQGGPNKPWPLDPSIDAVADLALLRPSATPNANALSVSPHAQGSMFGKGFGIATMFPSSCEVWDTSVATPTGTGQVPAYTGYLNPYTPMLDDMFPFSPVARSRPNEDMDWLYTSPFTPSP